MFLAWFVLLAVSLSTPCCLLFLLPKSGTNHLPHVLPCASLFFSPPCPSSEPPLERRKRQAKECLVSWKQPAPKPISVLPEWEHGLAPHQDCAPRQRCNRLLSRLLWRWGGWRGTGTAQWRSERLSCTYQSLGVFLNDRRALRFLELYFVNDFPCPGNLCLLAEQDVSWMSGRHHQRTTPSFFWKRRCTWKWRPAKMHAHFLSSCWVPVEWTFTTASTIVSLVVWKWTLRQLSFLDCRNEDGGGMCRFCGLNEECRLVKSLSWRLAEYLDNGLAVGCVDKLTFFCYACRKKIKHFQFLFLKLVC